jgi:DNA-binding NarL/FixJ family response regulator
MKKSSGPNRSRSPEGAALSKREVQWLDMASRGFTDRQIGEAMSVTVNTAHDYAKGVFAKLGVASRAEAATQHLRDKVVALEKKVVELEEKLTRTHGEHGG